MAAKQLTSLQRLRHKLFYNVLYFALWTVGSTFAFSVALLLAGKGDNDPSKYTDGLDKKAKTKVEYKRKLREKALASEDVATKKDGLPTGQYAVKKWVVLDLGEKPSKEQYDLSEGGKFWKLTVNVEGCADPVSLTLDDLSKDMKEYNNFQWHCVTGWTKSDLNFKGVSIDCLIKAVRMKLEEKGLQYDDSWQYIIQRSPEGYVVPVFRQDIEGAFLAVLHDDELIEMKHGGPRLVFPLLFGWKSCKWVNEIELTTTYSKGFWERIGCHARGRVEHNERWAPNAGALWRFASAVTKIIFKVFGEDAGNRILRFQEAMMAVIVGNLKRSLGLKDNE